MSYHSFTTHCSSTRLPYQLRYFCEAEPAFQLNSKRIKYSVTEVTGALDNPTSTGAACDICLQGKHGSERISKLELLAQQIYFKGFLTTTTHSVNIHRLTNSNIKGICNLSIKFINIISYDFHIANKDKLL